jgi:hypothetical protein
LRHRLLIYLKSVRNETSVKLGVSSSFFLFPSFRGASATIEIKKKIFPAEA